MSQAKRARTEAGPGEGVLRPDVTSPASRDALAAQYGKAKPYPHCVIPDICRPEALLAVRDEIIQNVQATYKETDLFNMFQTGDLANLDGLDEESAAKLKAVRALRDALYRPEFRAFVSAVTGCGELSDRTDCACNVHARGGHLLCHDDVIGTRAVSFIIYLTDPEQPWTPEDGGALELYPEHPDLKAQSAVFPTASVLPQWNTLAMFAVQPGVSFHSIQEVFTDAKPRMSIQGWFHRAEPPSNSEQATLRLLQLQDATQSAAFRPLRGGEEAGAGEAPCSDAAASEQPNGKGTGTPSPLPEAVLAELEPFINPVYLKPETWPKVTAAFTEEGSVQLQRLLRTDLADRVHASVTAADAAAGLLNTGAECPRFRGYDAGVIDGWQPVGPAFKQRFLRYTGETALERDGAPSSAEQDAPGPLLQRILQDLLATTAFKALIRKLTTFGVEEWRGEVRRFRPGSDYTVAHHGVLASAPCLDAVLCFLPGDAAAAAAWEGGELGGYEAYMLADEGEEGPAGQRAEVYRAAGEDGEETGVLNVCPTHNCLSLVLRDEETELLKFVKYVSAAAPGSRWDIALEYSLEDVEDDDEE